MSVPSAPVPSWRCSVLDAVRDGAGGFLEFQVPGSGSFTCTWLGAGLQESCWFLVACEFPGGVTPTCQSRAQQSCDAGLHRVKPKQGLTVVVVVRLDISQDQLLTSSERRP